MADLVKANIEVFNKEANTYETDFQEGIRMLCEETQRRRLWISSNWTDTPEGQGKELKVLEYACGPGHVSRTLEPFVTKAIGLDVSDGMVDEYNKKAREFGISPEKMSATIGNILDDDLQDPEYQNFDMVFISMALHHFSDPSLAIKRLVEKLRTGGVFWIIDLIDEPNAEHEHKHFSPETAATVHRHGFNVKEVEDMFSKAGVSMNVKVEVVDKPFQFTRKGHSLKKTIFFARGQKL
ncbi:SAM-dependent methyltransferase [Talaromyces proteolyticus]|uniref:SAM-dependent methyltransferase n=1 Tax=Talaromyces proteolyticus TaxID=1131652 RepID=A0AAD4KUY5_9EURO|nr:SAM-dependent methyltransferase [Talaromyces proteolyticus]KAH8701697.1 SAM-dependent methyltransferase [Talaromyces proteolyticus]